MKRHLLLRSLAIVAGGQVPGALATVRITHADA
jgi:hypothetical protein